LDRHTDRIRWTYNIKQDGDQTSFHGDPLVTDVLILVLPRISCAKESMFTQSPSAMKCFA
jgi:hypothetical protein